MHFDGGGGDFQPLAPSLGAVCSLFCFLFKRNCAAGRREVSLGILLVGSAFSTSSYSTTLCGEINCLLFWYFLSFASFILEEVPRQVNSVF